jgi:hypothetical protein
VELKKLAERFNNCIDCVDINPAASSDASHNFASFLAPSESRHQESAVQLEKQMKSMWNSQNLQSASKIIRRRITCVMESACHHFVEILDLFLAGFLLAKIQTKFKFCLKARPGKPRRLRQCRRRCPARPALPCAQRPSALST